MLVLGKKTDYALISLLWLSEHDGRCVSAREIAQANALPLPALMQILKTLHQHGVLHSTRGVKGGYRIAVELDSLSLQALTQMLSAAEVDEPTPDVETQRTDPPLVAMRRKLTEFLENVSVADVVRPGRHKIDVPIKALRIAERVTA